MNAKQHERMRTGKGFIAALDQSGGSTPKALKLYGIDESKYKGEDQMFDMIHHARSRLITSPSFTSDGVLAAILFEQTMDREISGKPTATYLWEDKGIVPILKVDKGIADAADRVQLMKPVPDLDKLLKRAVEKGIYGTKERSVIKEPNKAGIKAIGSPAVRVGQADSAHGLVPILEPEADIKRKRSTRPPRLTTLSFVRPRSVAEGVNRCGCSGRWAASPGFRVARLPDRAR